MRLFTWFILSSLIFAFQANAIEKIFIDPNMQTVNSTPFRVDNSGNFLTVIGGGCQNGVGVELVATSPAVEVVSKINFCGHRSYSTTGAGVMVASMQNGQLFAVNSSGKKVWSQPSQYKDVVVEKFRGLEPVHFNEFYQAKHIFTANHLGGCGVASIDAATGTVVAIKDFSNCERIETTVSRNGLLSVLTDKREFFLLDRNLNVLSTVQLTENLTLGTTLNNGSTFLNHSHQGYLLPQNQTTAVALTSADCGFSKDNVLGDDMLVVGQKIGWTENCHFQVLNSRTREAQYSGKSYSLMSDGNLALFDEGNLQIIDKSGSLVQIVTLPKGLSFLSEGQVVKLSETSLLASVCITDGSRCYRKSQLALLNEKGEVIDVFGKDSDRLIATQNDTHFFLGEDGLYKVNSNRGYPVCDPKKYWNIYRFQQKDVVSLLDNELVLFDKLIGRTRTVLPGPFRHLLSYQNGDLLLSDSNELKRISTDYTTAWSIPIDGNKIESLVILKSGRVRAALPQRFVEVEPNGRKIEYWDRKYNTRIQDISQNMLAQINVHPKGFLIQFHRRTDGVLITSTILKAPPYSSIDKMRTESGKLVMDISYSNMRRSSPRRKTIHTKIPKGAIGAPDESMPDISFPLRDNVCASGLEW